MTEEVKAPKRQYELIVKIGADSVESLCHALHQLEFEMSAREGGVPYSICGGPDYNWAVTLRHDPDMSHDRYFEELNAYLDAQKAEKNEADD